MFVKAPFTAFIALIFMSAIPIPAQALSVEVGELYSNISVPVEPHIYGEKVFYQDFIQGNYRFYTVDITTKTRTELRNNYTNYFWPYSFGGTHAGWITYSMGSGDSAIYKVQLIDVSSKITSDITSNGAYKDFLALDNQSVVWTDYRHSTVSDTYNEIYHSSLSSINPTRITNTVSYKASVDISGDLIVWQDYRNAGSTDNADIYLYDLGNNQEIAVCANSAYQDQPSVHGNYVVWQDYRNAGSSGNADIYMYDLIKNQEIEVCVVPGHQAHPKVYGDYIVWQDYRNKTTQDSTVADIYLYQISTGTEIAVTTSTGYMGPPSIYGSNIIWYDYTEDKIYIATIDGTNNVQPHITLTAPNGGENLITGSTTNIAWTFSSVANVKLEYTTNGGSTWTTIIDSTPAINRLHSWIVPEVFSTQCLIRISDASNSSMYDISDALFSIVENENVVDDKQYEFWLGRAYPNPFNPTTTIEFTLPAAAPVRLIVFTLTGQPVAELVNGTMDAGMYHVEWKAEGMPSGMYFYVLESSGRRESRKMLLVK